MADDEKWGLSREEINERIEKQNQKHKKKGKGRSENQRLKLFYLLSFYLFLNVSHLDRPFDGPEGENDPFC